MAYGMAGKSRLKRKASERVNPPSSPESRFKKRSSKKTGNPTLKRFGY